MSEMPKNHKELVASILMELKPLQFRRFKLKLQAAKYHWGWEFWPQGFSLVIFLCQPFNLWATMFTGPQSQKTLEWFYGKTICLRNGLATKSKGPSLKVGTTPFWGSGQLCRSSSVQGERASRPLHHPPPIGNYLGDQYQKLGLKNKHHIVMSSSFSWVPSFVITNSGLDLSGIGSKKIKPVPLALKDKKKIQII